DITPTRLLLHSCRTHRARHSFPTRRSSDLNLASVAPEKLRGLVDRAIQAVVAERQLDECEITLRDLELTAQSFAGSLEALYTSRSEEHTSELQSRFDLVCRLLLEKKNDLGGFVAAVEVDNLNLANTTHLFHAARHIALFITHKNDDADMQCDTRRHWPQHQPDRKA